jgi:hypothetical protein
MKHYKPHKLLNTQNPKTIKGEKKGVKTYILYMSPFTANSQGINLCPHASKGCAAACLNGSGFGGMYPHVADGRRNKTEYFLSDRTGFLNQLDKEIGSVIRNNKSDYKLAFRLNGTSDVRFEKFKIRDGKNIFELYPQVRFYDYTKNYLRFDQILPKNYSLTFSRSEINENKAVELLKRGHNVAVVFDKLPKTWNGYKVINGDLNDLRFKDKKNVVVGLKYKKMTSPGARTLNVGAIDSGFVVSNIQPLKLAA